MQPIHTDRLILRSFHEGDAEALFSYLQDPRPSCFFSMRLADLEEARAEVLKRQSDPEQLAVALKETDDLIGDLFLHSGEEDQTISVGWNFNAAYSGQGYATEAAQALFDHLFTQTDTRRIYAYVEDTNISSQRLCQRLGMRHEGTFIDYVSFHNDADGKPIFENTMQYAILRREWLARSA